MRFGGFNSLSIDFDLLGIDKSDYDSNKDKELEIEKNVCEIVRYTSENPTPWNWGFNYDYDNDSFDIAIERGYLDKIMPDEFPKYFEKYSKEDLILQSQSFINPKTSKEDVIKLLIDEADYSWIVSENGFKYLKSNPEYVFFTQHLIKFNLYEFLLFADKEDLSIEETGNRYIDLKLNKALLKGDVDCYLYYIDYHYTLALKKEDYNDALYYLCQRIIFQTNFWLLKKSYSLFDEAYDNETYYLSFMLVNLNLDYDLENIYQKAFDEFKISKYQFNREKIYQFMVRIIEGKEDVYEISGDLIDERDSH